MTDPVSENLDGSRRHRTSRPMMKDLANHVIPLVTTKWYSLGLQLLDDEYQNELDTIEMNTTNDVETSCRKMFQKWLSTEVLASWDLLIRALKAIHLKTVANDIEESVLEKTKLPDDEYDGGHHYHFVDSLPESSDLVCKLCHLPSRIPCCTSCCKYTFCKACIDKFMKNTMCCFYTMCGYYTCPFCNMCGFAMNQNCEIDHAVGNLHVYCLNEMEGCKWRGKVNEVATHTNSCQYEDVVCENNGCGDIVQRRLLKHHMESECRYRNVTCQHCHVKGDHCFIEGKHEDECPKFSLLCPNDCEVVNVTREELDKCSPPESIECEYYDMGCKTKIARKDIKEHNRENVEEHLCMLKCELARTKKDLVLAQKDAATAEKRMVDLQKEFQEQTMTAEKKLVDLQMKFQVQIDDTEAQGQEDIRRLEIQLYNSICQLHTKCNPWTLKLNTLAAMSTSGEQVVPVVLKMVNFSRMKRSWCSNHFYSHNKDCKMQLSVYEDDSMCRTSDCLSVRLSFEYCDSEMEFKGNIKLLNQIDDQEHHCVTVYSNQGRPRCTTARCMMVIINRVWENSSFIRIHKLNAVSRTCNYIKNNCLFFEVRMDAVEKSHLSCPLSCDKDVCVTELTCPLSPPNTESCNKCSASFGSIMKKKHNCGQCGGNYCGSCTLVVHQSTFEQMSRFAQSWSSDAMRICGDCNDKLKGIMTCSS